jgi:hypothetical protein
MQVIEPKLAAAALVVADLKQIEHSNFTDGNWGSRDDRRRDGN